MKKFFQYEEGTANKAMMCLVMLGVAAVVMMAPENAVAGGGGTEFDDVWTTLKDWTQGTLGRIVAGAMILIGIVGGIARQSLMAFAMGAGGGMGLYNSPSIVESIMSATVSSAEKINMVLPVLSNGLGS